MAYIRFTPDEFDAISRLCRPLDLGKTRPQFLKRLLVASLAEPLPRLAERVAALSPQQFHILIARLSEPTAEQSHGLTEAEVELVAEAGGVLIAHTRFAHVLKRSLVRRLVEWHPTLAVKVGRLSAAQFGLLCQEANERARGDG